MFVARGLPRPRSAAEAERLRSGALHEVRVPHPDARRRQAVHRRSTSRRTPALERYPILLTPHALQRRALRHRRLPGRASGPSAARRRRRATSSSTRTCAAASCRRASSSTCGRTTRAKGPKDVDESTDTYDTIDWLREERAEQQRQGRHLGHLVSRLLRGAGGDRRASGAQGRLAAGARHRLVHRRRLPPQRRVLPAARLRLLRELRQAPARADDEVARRASTTAPPTATTSSSRMGPLAERRPKYFKGERRLLERADGAPDATTSSGRRANRGRTCKNDQARGADRRRLVRRRGPVRRRSRRTGRSRSRAPATANLLVMGPWPHGGWARGDGDALGDVDVRPEDLDFYREQIELPFFRRHLKGGEDAEAARGLRLRDRHQRVATRSTQWPPRDAQPRRRSTSPRRRASSTAAAVRDGEAASTSTSATRRSRCPSSRDVDIGMQRDYMTADQRFAARRPDVLVYQTEPLEEDLTVAGPIEASLYVSTTGTDADFVVKLIDVYPDDYPLQPGEGPGSRRPAHSKHGRLPAARARRAVARQVPQQLREAGAVRAGPGRGRRVHAARRLPHVPARATASWCRCRARGSRSSTAIRRRSWTSTRRRGPTSRKATQRVWRTKDQPSSVRSAW